MTQQPRRVWPIAAAIGGALLLYLLYTAQPGARLGIVYELLALGLVAAGVVLVGRRGERWLMGSVVVGVVLLLAILSYVPERGAEFGLLAGVGWRVVQIVVVLTLIYALFALGLNLQFGYTGLVNFGHVAFMSIGAYTAAILASHLGAPDVAPGWLAWALGPKFAQASLLWSLWYTFLIVAIAAVVAVAFALLLGIPTLRLREDYLAIVTIGFAEIIRLVWLNEQDLANGAQGLFTTIPGAAWILDENVGFASVTWFINDRWRIAIDPYYFWLTVLVAAALVIVYLLLERLAKSPWGRVVKAIREDEDVASALGKNVLVYKLQSLALGSVIAALAGVFYAWYYRYITPDSFLPIVTFYAFIIMVLGGVGNHKGMIIGAFVFWAIFEGARNVPFGDQVEDALGFSLFEGPGQVAFIGLLLVLIMMFRPQGVVGRREEMLFGK